MTNNSPFKEEQIQETKKSLVKWFLYIVNDNSGCGKIEVFVNAKDKIIDVKPTLFLRHTS